MKDFEIIQHQGETLALLLRNSFCEPGAHFFTPNNYSQQLGHMNHPAGKVIPAHLHNIKLRSIEITQEVLLIKKGKIRVDLYDHDRNYLESRELYSGDVLFLASGGHGFTMLEETEMVEIKQGPYMGDEDKVVFGKPAP
ncbi:MAG: hypothetical protein HQL31_05465 [Planctomycetes bacterium]|nr:hypothetical protein [Planctomycetota bacterium]